MEIQFHTLRDDIQDDLNDLTNKFDAYYGSLEELFTDQNENDTLKNFHDTIKNWYSLSLEDFFVKMQPIKKLFLPTCQAKKVNDFAENIQNWLPEIRASTTYSIIFKNLYQQLCNEIGYLAEKMNKPETSQSAFLSGLSDISMLIGTISAEIKDGNNKTLREINDTLKNLNNLLMNLEKARGAATLISLIESKVTNQHILNNYYLGWSGRLISLLEEKDDD